MSGGTNQKIKDQNKQIEKQYEYDRKMHDYTQRTNQYRYDQAVLNRELQQANLQKIADYKNKVAEQQYKQQEDLQTRQFELDKRAYKQSLEDYDQQTQLNSMSGALALESVNRAKQEALIKRNFDLKEQSINFRDQQGDLKDDKKLLQSGFKFAREQKTIDLGSIRSKMAFAKDDASLDRRDVSEEKTYISEANIEKEIKFDLSKEKLNRDIGFLDSSSGWDIRAAQAAYDKQQAPNFNQRIEALIEREKVTGQARASGREGLSAEREVTTALADYGRKQAMLVDSLVFAKEDKDLANTKITGTKDYQTDQKETDIDILKTDRKLDVLSTNRQLAKLDIKDSKIDLALNQTLDQLTFDSRRVKSSFRRTERDFDTNLAKNIRKQKTLDKRNDLARAKIKTTYDSAKLQFKADRNKIKLDEYAANLRAQGQVMQRPMKPVPLPIPYKTPVSTLPLPTAPFTSPKPIKGALGKTSVWNDIGDAANFGLTIAGIFS